MAVDSDHHAVRARVQKMIKKFNSQSHPFKLSMSIGAATPETDDEKLETLLSRADKEMYAEKLLHKQQKQTSSTTHS